MSDPEDEHDQLVIMNPVDDPVLAHADPIEIVLPLELDRPSGPRTDGKLVDTPGDPPLNGPWEVFELSTRGRSELNAVLRGWDASHDALGRSARLSSVRASKLLSGSRPFSS
jgi:hypothetical protein